MEECMCLNCCEILQHIAGGDTIDQEINKAKQMGSINECKRIYFGSYFCGQYFCHLPEGQIHKLLDYSRKNQIKLTLTVPILTEKYLKQGKRRIKQLSEVFGELIDEVTVNDYGMLDTIYNDYVQEKPQVKLNLGRLLMKDYRDPRYTEYFNMPLKPRSFTDYLNELIKKYKINLIEFDPTHAVIDFSEKPEGIDIALHQPYCYETVGQICQMAGIDKPVEEKFRPNEPCKQQCQEHHIHYFIEEGFTWLKYGKAVYFKNEQCKAKGLDKIRLIYSPLEWEENK